MKFSLLIPLLLLSIYGYGQTTQFERSKGKESAPYFEGITWWEQFAKTYSEAHITTFGETDAGYPLHIIWLSDDAYELADLANSNKTILLINNAIHPGEPDGVDASMMLFRDVLAKSRNKDLLHNVILVCIPYYNIGGAINRNSYSRANQDGPSEYGFRGNAQNLDLNRDFIKCDSKNAASFTKLLLFLNPDVYVETHVSNGADYQYTITYLPTQPDKLGGQMGTYLRNIMIPELEQKMWDKDEAMVPYVNVHSGPLGTSYETFYDSPRYSSGLAALHQVFGFITETHMLKPFQQRVWATYKYLMASLEFCSENKVAIKAERAKAKKEVMMQNEFPIDWQVDTSRFVHFNFNGFEHGYKKSEVSGQDRLFYDRSKPIKKDMSFYAYMKAIATVNKPSFYILKKGYTDVEERLKWNNVLMIPLKKDTLIKVVSYKIINYETTNTPYEKHYMHFNTTYEPEIMNWQFHAGDFLIPMHTDKDRFVIETLEPQAPDSYFNWNFFDAILQQKEWYSPYVFEDKADELLKKDSRLKKEFEVKKLSDKEFSANAQAQLYWVYVHSPYYEKEHMRLPVFRIE